MKLVLVTIIVIQLLIRGIGGATCSPNFEQGKRSSKGSSREQSAVPEHHDSSSKDESIPIGPTETKVKTFEEFSQGPQRGSFSAVTLPPLPEATDTFDSIRNKGKLFVDKTRYVKHFMDKGGLYVLTRPKRFGKSVFLQMVRRFLEGKKEFFKDTEIATRGNGLAEDGEWTSYPVVYIDFEDIPVTGTATQFQMELTTMLNEIATSHDPTIQSVLSVGHLIRVLKKRTGKPVSILVDNYDLPLMKKFSTEKREELVTILAEFYGQIRANVDNVRLGLAIGISKLNILSRFSDLTFDERFSSIMGFNSKEVEQHLRPYFERFDDGSKKQKSETIPRSEEARTWYGGHQFAVGNKIMKTLNPSSTCECLRRKKFGDYTGNTVLVSIIKDKMLKSKVTMKALEDFKMEVSELQKFYLKEDEISLPLFMLCNGFLTIKNYNEKSEVVSLGYPNEEIRRNLVEQLPETLVGEYGLKNALMKKDVHAFVNLLNEYIFNCLNLPLTEFIATRQILPLLKGNGIKYKEREILRTNDGQNKGDLDIHIMLDKSEFVIGMKYKKRGADSILALIKYIMKSEDAFRCRICEDKEIFLLGINVIPLTMKGDIVTTAVINEWVLLPYRDCKIWMSECVTSLNIAPTFVTYFKERLNKNMREYVTSPKIIW